MRRFRFAAVALALGLAAPAAAQVPLDPLDDHSAKRLDRMEQALREIRAIVFQGRETGRPVVVEPADTDAQLQTLSQKIDSLQQAVTRLTGELESAAHDVDEARHEADALREENGQLTARVAALEQKAQAAAAPPPEAVVPAAPPPPADPAAAMGAAREAYNAGDYAAAETGFRDVAARSGETPRGMEAKYYLGKIMLKREAYADAAAMDLGVVRQWPATSWAPDAALDLARAMVGMNQTREACGVLAQIDTHYPKAAASVKTGALDVKAQAGCGAAG
ncbi:MAG TPA: tol-pal system protein YbgF [Caulobacteraceae bacterium]|nr:tol-pal system protein YbgF [Caulobacteraceae bacterium]